MKPVSELRALGERNGWKVGPLTQGQIHRMSSDEADFHSKLNKEEFEKALDAPRNKAAADKEAAKAAEETERGKVENDKNRKLWAGKKYWESDKTPEDVQAMQKEYAAFQRLYPQLTVTKENGEAITSWLEMHTLPVNVENVAEAFRTLARAGDLVLDLNACGIIRIRIGSGSELDIRAEELPNYQRKNGYEYITLAGVHNRTRKLVQKNVEILPIKEGITGARLARHPLLETILAPYNEEAEASRRQGAMSADEYRNAHPEAWRDPRAYADAAEKIKREINSFRSFHPEYRLTEENSKHLQAYIAKRKLPFNRESLEAAYSELVREGYIETNLETVVSSGSTKLIDYGRQSAKPQDYSKVRAEVNRMDSKQYAEWTRDPANRKLAEEAFATT